MSRPKRKSKVSFDDTLLDDIEALRTHDLDLNRSLSIAKEVSKVKPQINLHDQAIADRFRERLIRKDLLDRGLEAERFPLREKKSDKKAADKLAAYAQQYFELDRIELLEAMSEPDKGEEGKNGYATPSDRRTPEATDPGLDLPKGDDQGQEANQPTPGRTQTNIALQNELLLPKLDEEGQTSSQDNPLDPNLEVFKNVIVQWNREMNARLDAISTSQSLVIASVKSLEARMDGFEQRMEDILNAVHRIPSTLVDMGFLGKEDTQSENSVSISDENYKSKPEKSHLSPDALKRFSDYYDLNLASRKYKGLTREVFLDSFTRGKHIWAHLREKYPGLSLSPDLTSGYDAAPRMEHYDRIDGEICRVTSKAHKKRDAYLPATGKGTRTPVVVPRRDESSDEDSGDNLKNMKELLYQQSRRKHE